jgi:arrestin-1
LYSIESLELFFIQVKLFLGAIGGELSAELPFVLMHPKPNMKKILKADTLAEVEGFQV